MKPQRVVNLIGIVATILLVIALVVMAVTVLDTWWALAALAVVALLAQMVVSVLRKRVKGGTVLELDLDGGVMEKAGSDPISRALNRKAVMVRDVVDALDRAGEDRRIVGLVARVGNGGIDVAHAQELRDAVHRFRGSGKKTVAFAEAFGEGGRAIVDYYLATAFEEIHLQPMGLASVEGMVARGTFLRGVFDNLGVIPDFDHRREYKAAKYMFTETGFTEPHREALGSVAEDRFGQLIDGIAADRGLDPDTVRSLVDRAPISADTALDQGLVDILGYRDQAYRAAGDDGKSFLFHDRYLKKAGRPHRKGKRIALIYGAGSINRGSSRFDPLGRGPSMGADEVAKAFRAACDEDKVKAIVFRVDSPGGSAVASEVVSREVQRAREEAGKPVVVSMGNVAGSGGYWVAMGADRIVAQPGTITGSIGVVWGKLANRAAWARLGITFDEILFGRNATFASAQDVYTDSERERRTELIEDVYTAFKDGVAAGREMSPERVELIAKGRIWSGARARELGLVDELGGLDAAVRIAKELAEIAEDQSVQLVVYPKEKALPLPRTEDSSQPIHAVATVLADLIQSGRDETAIQARMPPVLFL